MTYPSSARPLLLVLVTILLSVTVSSVSLAASSAPHHGPEKLGAGPRHAPLHRSPTRETATAAKSKQPPAQPKTHRKTPVNARVATKSKAQKNAPKAPTQVAKPMPKHAKSVG